MHFSNKGLSLCMQIMVFIMLGLGLHIDKEVLCLNEICYLDLCIHLTTLGVGARPWHEGALIMTTEAYTQLNIKCN